MATSTRITLSDQDRAKIKAAREKLGLSQTEAAKLAWPTNKAGQISWCRMETDPNRSLWAATLAPALAAIGLQISEPKITKTK